MAKFRSWNKDKEVFSYFEDGKYYHDEKCHEPNLAEHFNFIPFDWPNAELIDSKEKQLLLCQLRRKRKTLGNINYQIDSIEDFKPGYALIKMNLIADKNIKEYEINNIETVLVDVFHVTEKELKEI